mmetsp:Transcript_44969/g.43547  ORF Transcript_44969/g.43547 Transcript_44969/m.43547 type:complete len:145 (-) Transcript_44969:30-464(-)
MTAIDFMMVHYSNGHQYTICDQTIFSSFFLNWELLGDETEENFDFRIIRFPYDYDTDTCNVLFADCESPLLKKDNIYPSFYDDKDETNFCGANIFLNYKDDDDSQATATMIHLELNEQVEFPPETNANLVTLGMAMATVLLTFL